MTTFAWPATLIPSRFDIALQPNVREFESPFSRAHQTVDLLGERWKVSVTLPPVRRVNAGAREAFFLRLRGVHWVSAWHFAREIPAGTMRGSPTAAAAAQGADTLTLNTAASVTLQAGDMFGIAGQLFMAAAFAQASAQGVMSVPVCNRTRVAITAGAAVTWSRPTATFRLQDPAAFSHVPGYSEPASFDLIETW